MNSAKAWRRLVATVLSAAILMGPGRMVWLPWLSVGYSAELLAEDDGLGLIMWAPNAAERWGVAVIPPLSSATEEFASIRPVAAFVLLDIISNAPSKDLAEATPLLLASKSSTGRYLGLLAAHRVRVLPPDHAARSLELQSSIERVPVSNDMDAVIAIRVAGAVGVPEVGDALSRNLLAPLTPALVASASCVAAAGMPAAPRLVAALQATITRIDFPARAACERSLDTLIGKQAAK